MAAFCGDHIFESYPVCAPASGKGTGLLRASIQLAENTLTNKHKCQLLSGLLPQTSAKSIPEDGPPVKYAVRIFPAAVVDKRGFL